MFCKSYGRYFLVSSIIVDEYCCISNQVKRSILFALTTKVSINDMAFDNFVSSYTISRVLAKFDNCFLPRRFDKEP